MKAAEIRVILIVLVAFGAYYMVDELLFANIRAWFTSFTEQQGVSHILAYVLVGIPVFAGALVSRSARTFFKDLGLSGNLAQALIYSFAFTAPMLAGYALVFSFNAEISLDDVLIGSVAAAFFEELYFRGFLFGWLFRFTRFGFIPSVLLGALIFASMHLYQSQDPATLIGIFMTTLLGGILFAWVYAEWDFNLWMPIGLHLFMNLFWDLFSAGDNAFGGLWSNVFRVITIALIIIGTIRYKKWKNQPPTITRRTLWMKPGR
ncbi:MAG: CPBP family intramembrane glutamic endopeptidase [Bacteroidota bacterium]